MESGHGLAAVHDAHEPWGLALALALALPSGIKIKIKSRDGFMGSTRFFLELHDAHEPHVLCCGRDVRGPGGFMGRNSARRLLIPFGFILRVLTGRVCQPSPTTIPVQ
jgi:hypothetical protein